MGFFSRLANLFKGMASLWVSDAERKRAEVAYENAINSMLVKYAKLKSATASIIRRRDDITERLTTERGELNKVSADVNTAIDTNQDDLALVLLQKKQTSEAEIDSLRKELDTAERDANEAKTSLMSVREEINKLKAEKDRMLAKMQSAEARLKVQEQIEGLSIDDEVRALDNVRDHIKNTIAEADLGKELSGSDLDNRLSHLRKQTGESAAKAQLEALKKARAASAGQSTGDPNKSM